MGLFKKSYVRRIKQIMERLDDLDLNDDDLILKFKSIRNEIEKEDIECITLLKRLVRGGHISEKLKRDLLNQLIFLFRKLETLRFEDKENLRMIKTEIEEVLEVELTTERIGVEVTKPLYHGSGISGIGAFDPTIIDYEAAKTLGVAMYLTDNNRMGINYANYRYGCLMYQDNVEEEVKTRFRKRIKRTVYTVRFKKKRNYVADLNDSIKLRAIYKDLRRFCLKYDVEKEEPPRMRDFRQRQVVGFADYLKYLLDNGILYRNIHYLLRDKGEYKPSGGIEYHAPFESAIQFVFKFLKEKGFHGLRCPEYGEHEESIFPWEGSMSYVVFDPNDIEILNEEHYDVVDKKLIKVK